MSDIVDQGQSLGEIFVELKSTGNGAGDLGHFHGVSEPAAKVIGVAVGEDLSLTGQPPESAGVNDASAIALKGVAIGVFPLEVLPLGQLRVGRQDRAARRQRPDVARGSAAFFIARCHGLAQKEQAIAWGWRSSIRPWPT